jgi:hypothetical protein
VRVSLFLSHVLSSVLSNYYCTYCIRAVLLTLPGSHANNPVVIRTRFITSAVRALSFLIYTKIPEKKNYKKKNIKIPKTRSYHRDAYRISSNQHKSNKFSIFSNTITNIHEKNPNNLNCMQKLSKILCSTDYFLLNQNHTSHHRSIAVEVASYPCILLPIM